MGKDDIGEGVNDNIDNSNIDDWSVDIPKFDDLYTSNIGSDFQVNSYDMEMNSNVDDIFKSSSNDEKTELSNPYSGIEYESTDQNTYTSSDIQSNNNKTNTNQSEYQFSNNYNNNQYNAYEQTYSTYKIADTYNEKTSVIAIIGFIFSIIGLLCCFMPCCPGIISIIAFILCIIGVSKDSKKGLGLAGIIISIIGLVGTIIFTIMWFDETSILNEYLDEYLYEYDSVTYEYNDEDNYNYFENYIDERLNPLKTPISEYNEIRIGENVYAMPISCKDLDFTYDLDDDDMEELENGIDTNGYIIASICLEEYKTELFVSLCNKTNHIVTDIEELTIDYIATSTYRDDDYNRYLADIEMFGGIRIASTKEEVLKVMGEPSDSYEYDSEDFSYCDVYYYLDDVYITITFINGKVGDIYISIYQ